MNENAKDILKQLKDEDKDILKQRFEAFDHMSKLYDENEDFRRFVDKDCRSYGYQKEFAFLCKTVQEVGYYYANKDKDVIKHDICPCGIDAEDKAC